MRPRTLSTWSALLLAFGLSLVSSAALAGTEEAREFFKEAKRAYGNKEYERAAELLKKAYSEEANLTYQYNRIRALQGAGRYEDALEVLKTYEKPMLDAKGFEDVPSIKESLQKKVGPTESSSTSGGSGESGSSQTSGTSTAGSGGSDPGTSSGSSNAGRSPGMEALGWGLAGAGVASIGIGTLFGSLALLPPDVRKNARKDQVKPENADLVRSHKTATVIFLVAGTGALIGGGVVLYNQFTAGPEQAAASNGDGPRVRWRPFATPDSAGAALEIRF